MKIPLGLIVTDTVLSEYRSDQSILCVCVCVCVCAGGGGQLLPNINSQQTNELWLVQNVPYKMVPTKYSFTVYIHLIDTWINRIWH